MDEVNGVLTLINGVPGCGKTTYFVQQAEPGDLVLTVARETKDEIEDKLQELRKDTVNVRTVDSFIMH